MKPRTWTDEQLKQAVKKSVSLRQVLAHLGLKIGGGTQEGIIRHIARLKLDTSDFTGQLWSKGRSLGHKYELEEYLSSERNIKSWNLKNRLWAAGILPRKCMACGIAQWLKQVAPLEIDHIDGTKTNNKLTNLRILCRNCHALTETYVRSKRDRQVNYWDKQTLEKIVRDCTSGTQVISKIGSNHYKLIFFLIEEYNIDTSHFTGIFNTLRGRKPSAESLSKYFTGRVKVGSTKLKILLWRARLLKKECYSCGITHWQGRLAPLCPNCHAFTPTFKTRNRKWPNREASTS